jgi:predicted Holliday junction resolvase-like endonuclease
VKLFLVGLMDFLFPLLAVVFLLLVVLLFFFYKKSCSLEESLGSLRFDKSSQSVRYGKTMEQWLPFSKDFPFSRQDFRFIGSPIDGIAFEKDKIVFVEVKAADSKLSERQKQIRGLVEQKKVEWFELDAK